MKAFQNSQLSKYLVWVECLVVFFMPLEIHLDSYCIFLLAVLWIISKGWGKLMSNPPQLRWALLFSSIFFIYLLRTLFSEDILASQAEIVRKLPLLLFPFLLLGRDSSKSNVVLLALPVGCLLASIICLSNAFVQSGIMGYSAFLYVNLSELMHPGYFTMYINFSIFILLYQLFFVSNTSSKIIKGAYILLVLFFMVMIILLSSKAGILGFYLVAAFAALVLYIKKGNVVLPLILVVGSILLFSIFSHVLLRGQPTRLTQTAQALHNDTSYADSTETGEMRVLLWKASIEVIRNNFWMGVGFHDEMDTLKKIYARENMTRAFRTNLNPHNQFLETFVLLGIVGFLILLIIIAAPAWVSLKVKNYYFLIFIALIILNFLTESMLQTQAGVVFYAFFNSYLFRKEKDEE